MSKKLFKGILITTLMGAMFLFSGCSKDNKLNNKSTLDKDTIIVGMDDAFEPMGFKDEDGKITGFDVDLAKALGKELNKKIEFQPIDWTMKESELKEFRQILKYFPLVGISISQLATEIGINSSTLYNYRNGLIPKQDKYNAIMDKLKTDFPKEF